MINYTYDGNYFVRAKNGSMLEIIPSEGERGAAENERPGHPSSGDPGGRFRRGVGATCKSKGVKFLGEPINNQGNRLVFFADGDGNFVHLVHRAKPLA